MLDACIIGAPKCGTSSLFRWLTAHPQITGPCDGKKELFYFMDPGHPLTKTPNVHSSGIEDYESLFPRTNSTLKIEGTTHYLFQETAREALSEMSSEPLIVVVLRDPAERVWSSFQYTRNNLARMDRALSFRQYVDLSLGGKSNRVKEYVYHQESAYVLARSVKYGRYIKYLNKWRQAVGSKRLVVLSFSDVVANSKSVCERLANKVGVDGAFYDDFEYRSSNSTYRPVLRPLQSLARTVNQHVPDGALMQVAKRMYKQVATRPSSPSRSDEDEKALKRLRTHYTPYNNQLADEFDISVTAWA